MKIQLGRVLLLLLCSSSSTAFGAAFGGSDKPPIPPDLLIEVKSIPADDNAIVWWRRAAKELQKPDDELDEAIRFVTKVGERRPDADQLERISNWISRNRNALDLFRTGNAKPFAQWPERDPQALQPELNVRWFFVMELFEADALIEAGEVERGSQRLLELLRSAERAVQAEGGVLNFLVGTSVRSFVHGGILRSAVHAKAKSETLVTLLAALPRADSDTNAYSRALRFEYTFFAHPELDVMRLAREWQSSSDTEAALLFWPEELHRPFKILLDPGLVQLHPKPWDQEETLKWNAHTYRTYHANVLGRWADRIDPAEKKEQFIEALVEDVETLMDLTADEPLPLSRPAVQKARAAYLKIKNPVGRIFHCSSGGSITSDARVFKSRTEREAVRTLLALRVFEQKAGGLPERLQELVDEKILDGLPWDYFADKPLRYSRERRTFWSVGEDEVDDGGSGDEAAPWAGNDAIWKLPTKE